MDELTGILAIIFIFGTPGLLIAFNMLRGNFAEKARRKEREQARRMYERVMHHKLEVVETALAMGFRHDEVRALDLRLERLIGAERMACLLDVKTPGIPSTGELPSNDELEREIQGMRRERERV